MMLATTTHPAPVTDDPQLDTRATVKRVQAYLDSFAPGRVVLDDDPEEGPALFADDLRLLLAIARATHADQDARPERGEDAPRQFEASEAASA